MVLSVIAFMYVVFAIADGRTGVIIMDVAGALCFSAVALRQRRFAC